MAVTAVTPTHHSVMAMGLSAHAWIPRHPTTTTRTTAQATTRTRRRPTTRTHQLHTTTPRPPPPTSTAELEVAEEAINAERLGTVMAGVIR
jgi:hypothetical protein